MKATTLAGHDNLERLVRPAVWPNFSPDANRTRAGTGTHGLNHADIKIRMDWHASKFEDGAFGNRSTTGLVKTADPQAASSKRAFAFPCVEGADADGRIKAAGEKVDFSTFPCAPTTAEALALQARPRPVKAAAMFGSSGGGGMAAQARLLPSAPTDDIAPMAATAAALPTDKPFAVDAGRACLPGVTARAPKAAALRRRAEPRATPGQSPPLARQVHGPVLPGGRPHDSPDCLDACEGARIKPNQAVGPTPPLPIRGPSLPISRQVDAKEADGSAPAAAATCRASTSPSSGQPASRLCCGHLLVHPAPGRDTGDPGGLAATPPSEPGLGILPERTRLNDPAAVREAGE